MHAARVLRVGRPRDDDAERNGWTLLDGGVQGRQFSTGTRSRRQRRVISCEVISFLLSQGASVDYQDPDGHVHCPLVAAQFLLKILRVMQMA